MKTIYLFRHSIPKKSDGPNPEIPLSEEGKKAIRDLIDRSGLKIDRVYSSPYRRARETASRFGTLSVLADERLCERRIGDPDRFTPEKWARQYSDPHFRDENGESFDETRIRMTECLSEILETMMDGENVAVVSHAGAICAYLQNFCDIHVVDAEGKIRRIIREGTCIHEGTIQTPSFFEMSFRDNRLMNVRYRT